MQRFFGNAPLAPLGLALVEEEQEKTQRVEKQEGCYKCVDQKKVG